MIARGEIPGIDGCRFFASAGQEKRVPADSRKGRGVAVLGRTTEPLPAYIQLSARGGLSERIAETFAILKHCTLCPRKCGVNRLGGETGVCGTGKWPVVSSYGPHFGEENPLVGRGGSGTVFMTHCNLLCVFCQNHEISHEGRGEELAIEGLSEILLRLQKEGCHNINCVTPTHAIPSILAALPGAIESGLNIPLVYNSSGYDTVESLRLLDGIFDIYMPDFKFWDSEVSRTYMKAPDYPERAREAVGEMHRQVGDLVIDKTGNARRGILVRHLVMPNGLAGTREIMRFLYREVSPRTYVNVMEQYHPCHEAGRYPELNRPLTEREYRDAVSAAEEDGISRLDSRERKFMAYWK